MPDFVIPKSDVYVFMSKSGLECCGCKLSSKSFFATTYTEMIAHLQAHIEAGHTVPKHVIPMLEDEMLEYGDSTEEEPNDPEK
jgi:hypothetical protein